MMSSTNAAKNQQRLLPAETVDQRDRERREQELPERTGSRAGAERERAPVRRHQLAEGADHDGEGRAGKAEADHHAGGEMEHAGRARVGHAGETERIEDRADAQHPDRTVAIRDRRRRTAGPRPTAASESRARARTRRGPSRCASTSASGRIRVPNARRSRAADQATAQQDDRGRAPSGGLRGHDDGGLRRSRSSLGC